MGLFNDLVKEVACLHFAVAKNGNAFLLSLIDRALKLAALHFGNIWEAKFPVPIFLDGAHERVSNAHRDIEISNIVFVGLGGNKVFHIRVVDAQHSHIGTPSCSALRNLAERMIVDSQKADRSGCLTSGGLNA